MAQVNWEFSEAETSNVRGIVDEQGNNPFVKSDEPRTLWRLRSVLLQISSGTLIWPLC